jgi:integral membrane protein
VNILSRPLELFRRVAVAEAITWALLLSGMVLKYGTHTTDVAVKVFGMIHGIVFISYVVTTVTVWVDQKWTVRRGIGALLASIPPFVTIVVELLAVRRGWIGAAWRLRTSDSASLSRPEAVVRWVLVAPVRGLAVAVAAVAVLTGLALLVGPPASS